MVKSEVGEGEGCRGNSSRCGVGGYSSNACIIASAPKFRRNAAY